MKTDFQYLLKQDVKAELLVNLIWSLVSPVPPLVYKPVGLLKRPARNDVESICIDTPLDSDNQFLYVEVHREGLYDTLPEGMFHQPINNKSFKNKEEVIDEIKIHRQEESDARLFFQPLDNEFFSTRVLIEQVENNSFLGYADQREFSAFDNFWKLGFFLKRDQKSILLKMLPLFYKKRGNFSFICYLLNQLTGLQYSFVRSDLWHRSEYHTLQGALGDSTLGQDCILGDSFYCHSFGIELIAECQNEKQLRQIIVGGPLFKTIHLILDMLCDMDIKVVVAPCLEKGKNNFLISSDKEECYLGFNSILAEA